MKIFCIISNKKHAGKTYTSSILVSSLLDIDKSVCYYKPFIMEVKDGKFFDVDYIKRTTYLNVSDIYTSFATTGNFSPLHSIDSNIDERDILDLIEETSKYYDYMIFESLCLYDPIKEGYNFSDLISDIPKNIEVCFIPVIEYDENIISSVLKEIELCHARGFKISAVLINTLKDLYVSEEIINYLKNQIDPLKIFTINFDNNAGIEKIKDLKYPDIIKHII